MTAHIQSRLMLGATCSPETEAEIRKTSDAHKHTAVTFMLFKASVGHKTINCCMSGGRLDPDTKQPEFTLIGLASVEALMRTFPKASALIYQELKRGKTPLQEKIKAAILAAPEDAIICFVGDMAKELDGLSKEFNPTGEPILLNGFAEF